MIPSSLPFNLAIWHIEQGLKTYKVRFVDAEGQPYFVMFKGSSTVEVYGKAKLFADAMGLRLGVILEA